MTTASRSLATALWGARFASGLLQPSYTTGWDTIQHPVIVEEESEREEVEKRLGALIKQLPANTRQPIEAQRLARVPVYDQATPTRLTAAAPRPATPARVRAAVDPLKAQRDAEKGRALCAAYKGNIPGMPNACASAPQ